jgi:hypothetical protein
MSEITLSQALDLVLDSCPNQYAKAYAQQARTMTPGTEEHRTQLLYVKSNLSYWRGDTARSVKAVIDQNI